MNCPNCNIPVEADEEFCGNCGQPLKNPIGQDQTAPANQSSNWGTESAETRFLSSSQATPAPSSDFYLTNPTPPPSAPPFSAPPTAVPAASATRLESSVPGPLGRQRKRSVALILVAVLLVLSSSGIGAYLLTHRASGAPSSGSVGQVAFFSSGQLNSQGVSSINDGIQIHLEHVANLSPGNRYYAWLQDAQTEATSVYLGSLTVNQGVVSLSYTDPQHRDLLSFASSFLVTEETSSVTPNNPSLDKGQWRYAASLPQVRSPKDNFSYLDHTRHLLSSDPDLERLKLRGGLNFWFLNNMEQLQKAGIETKDTMDLQVARQQITNLLYYLDGPCAPQEVKGAPVPASPENPTIAHASTIGLLDCAQVPKPPGYLTHIGNHLSGIAQAPGVTASQVQRAIEINKNLNLINASLVQVHQDALKLAVMDDGQLSQAHALRNDLVIQADNAVNGRIDPATQATQPSVRQLGNMIEVLANFTVMPYKS